LYEGHLTNVLPLGRAKELHESFDGLHGVFEIAPTQAGDDALTLIHAGVADSFSVSFTPIRQRDDHGVTIRVECRLEEVSLVGRPAYDDARIVGVRSAPLPGVIPRSIAEARLKLASRGR
jgi:HK97 family phage prohead protease